MRTPRMILKYMWYILQITSYLLARSSNDTQTPQNYNTALQAWSSAQATFVNLLLDAGYSIEDLER